MFGFTALKATKLFVVLLVANLLLAAAITSTVTEGEFRWDAAGNTFSGFFGGLESFGALIGALVVIGGAFALTYWLSKTGRHVLAGAVTLAALFFGGYLLYKLVHWDDVKFDTGTVIALLVFTLVETAVGVAFAGATIIRRRTPAVVTETETATV